MDRKSGRFETTTHLGESVRSFVPDALPPEPPLHISTELREELDQALLALGRLDSVSRLLPDTSLVLYSYIRKEAVLSSQIEGTQSSLSDLLVYEAEGTPGAPMNDVREVSNYASALDHGLKRLKEDFPMSLRLLREMHAILMKEGRGGQFSPGEFRHSQNWIGGSRPGNAFFVPPSPEKVGPLMGDLEAFIHNDPVKTSSLVKAALAHVQFETIHPFLDGNGRLGRLFITLLLCWEGVLQEPLLYLSLYFKTYREKYYELLQKVRTEGDWESWLSFFAQAVRKTAMQAVETVSEIHRLSEKDRGRIQDLGKASGSALRVHQILIERPIVSVAGVCARTKLVPNTVSAMMRHLGEIGIVRELTGNKRKRLFVYQNYFDILNRGLT